MKKIFSTMMVAALVSMTFTGCIEEIDPQTSTVTEKQAKEAPGAFDNFVDNLTGNLTGQFTYSGSSHYVFDFGYPAFFLIRDVMGQDIVPVGTNNWFDTWYQDFAYLAPNYARTQFPWTLYFGWIKDCNTVLTLGESIDYAQPTEGREAGVGIAYALRAMYYFDMVRMYAAEPYIVNKQALTVPKVTEATTVEQVQHNPRMTWDEAFEFILKDLDMAENLLSNYKRKDVYTPDKSVVYGFKARVYLEKQDWANAEKYAKMAQEGYTMMSQEEFLSRDYGFNSPNSSWMFGVTFKDTDPNIVENDGDSSWGSVMMLENGFDCGYAANYGGPNVIDRHLYETIPETDFRKQCWVDFALEELVDPDAEELPADLVAGLSAYSDYPERIYAAGVSNASYGLGGLSVKFRNQAGKANVKYDAWVVAVPLMRVEEMKLIEIEAAGMQNEARGIELLNEFAKTRDPNYFYGTHKDAYYNTSTSQFQNEVWWQRRVELWGEGFATFDIKRLNKGIIRSYAGTNHIEECRFNVEGCPNWMVWCFVNTEAQYNESLVVNPNPLRPSGDSDEFVW
ncbi:MAG: RagB/SusD family nutrient uptake outer membrane protein [Prevotella sp.]|nr:RagB/SusD family nutrient uptake outer membrane protein [Prevotella sp.]